MKLWAYCDNFYDSLTGLDDNRKIEVMCLKAATERFLKSGAKDDAFDVYFCFTEMFKVFGDGYKNKSAALTLLDILGDHEMNAGAVLDKHRDHYSHSVYNFALGITLYQISSKFQGEVSSFYKDKTYDGRQEFLYRWGTAALLHDVGYPFEIAFYSMKNYTKAMFGKFIPQLRFDIDAFIENADAVSSQLAPKKQIHILKDCHDLIADRISELFGFDKRDVRKRLDAHISGENEFTDHAYFGAIIVLKKMLENGSIDKLPLYVDTAVIILLHSGFWRRDLAKYETAGKSQKREAEIKLTPTMHPLVFLLNLCDELQVFNRIGYGYNSKDEPLPRTAYLDLTDKGVTVVYSFGDEALSYKNADGVPDTSFINKIKTKVMKDVVGVVDLSGYMDIDIDVVINNYEPSKVHTSASYFRYIFEIAQHIHKAYLEETLKTEISYEYLQEDWHNNLSLEFKMSNILAAKSYAYKLAECDYFYDDRVLGFEKVTALTDEEVERLAILEHERWYDEKKSMGWTYENYDASNAALKKAKRAERKHESLKPYSKLSEKIKELDRIVVRNMIGNLTAKREGKTGFYVYNGDIAEKYARTYYIGITGHRSEKISKFDIVKLESDLKSEFIKINDEYGKNIVILNSLADGFDLLAAKVAMEFKWGIKGVVTAPADEYFSTVGDQKTLKAVRSYAKYTELLVPKLFNCIYEDMSKYIASNCNKLICAWGGQTSTNLGGTYYTVDLVRQINRENPQSAPREIINVLEPQLKHTKA